MEYSQKTDKIHRVILTPPYLAPQKPPVNKMDREVQDKKNLLKNGDYF